MTSPPFQPWDGDSWDGLEDDEGPSFGEPFETDENDIEKDEWPTWNVGPEYLMWKELEDLLDDLLHGPDE